MEKGKSISFGKVIFIVFSVLIIGGGVLLLNYRNNEENNSTNTKQEQKDSDENKDGKKKDNKVYESFSYSRKDICGESDECEKKFTYDGKEYNLVIKKASSDIDSDEMDSMSFNSVTLNGVDIAEGAMDYFVKINFTKYGFIAIELSDSLTNNENTLVFYDTNLALVETYNSIRTFNYDGSNSGKFYSCAIKGSDDILKEYEFKITDGKFSDKIVSEKKENCFK